MRSLVLIAALALLCVCACTVLSVAEARKLAPYTAHNGKGPAGSGFYCAPRRVPSLKTPMYSLSGVLVGWLNPNLCTHGESKQPWQGCPCNSIPLARLERVKVKGQWAYGVRFDDQTPPSSDPAGHVGFGYVLTSSLAAGVATKWKQNGAFHLPSKTLGSKATCTGKTWTLKPSAGPLLPNTMNLAECKTVNGVNTVFNNLNNYINLEPRSSFGYPGVTPSMLLAWTPPNKPGHTCAEQYNPGGGVTRAVLSEGSQVKECDVERMVSGIWNYQGGAAGAQESGWIQYNYVRAESAGQTLYGWIVTEYQINGQPAYTLVH